MLLQIKMNIKLSDKFYMSGQKKSLYIYIEKRDRKDIYTYYYI